MKPKATDQKVSTSSPNLPQIMGKILIVYLISAATVLAICLIFGWRSLENIGTGFMYGSLVWHFSAHCFWQGIRFLLNFLNFHSLLLDPKKNTKAMALRLRMKEEDSFLRL